MKLTAGLIVRNEATNIERCLQSIRPHVDKLVIVDTGSTDKTPEIAKRYADVFEVFTGCNDADGVIQDFSVARNHVMKFVDPDSAFFWCDGDDVVEGAEHLRMLCRDPNPTLMYLFPYEYSYDEAGNVTTLHWRERLVRPAGSFVWKGPVHEVLMPKDGVAVAAVQVDMVRIKHRREGKSFESTRNLRILEKYVAGDGKGDLRSLFYYGMELKKVGRTQEARDALTEYVAMTGWSDEKCIAQLELATSYLSTGELEKAIEWGLQAQVTKSWADPYYFIGYALHGLAMQATDTEQKLYNYRRAAHYLRRGSEMALAKSGDTVLFSNPTELFQAQKVLCACLGSIGDWQGAYESTQLGLRGFPGHEGLLDYAKEFSKRRDMERVAALVNELTGAGHLTPQAQAVIYAALQERFKVKIKRDELVPPVKAEGCLDVVFYTGPAYEDWTPETIDAKGLGGSETMARELARRLAKMGHAVRVYGQPDQEGTYDEGVQYLHHDRWGDVTGDVLVCSRIPGAVDTGEFDLRLLWVHDVHCGDELTRARILKFDRVLALSNWHKQNLLDVYPMLDADKVIVTRNGIDLSRFKDFAGASEGLASPPQLLPTEAPAAIDLNGDWDWIETIVYAGPGFVSVALGSSASGSALPTEESFTSEGHHYVDVSEVTVKAFAEGENEGANWLLVFTTPDGRWWYVSAGCAFSGWDVGSRGHAIVSHSREHLYQFGLDDDARTRLKWLDSPAPAANLRNPHRAIYSSSPDRGLRLALELWPRIREKVPDAELHVFYGFENWEMSADQWGGHPELCRAALEQVKAGLKQPGVHYHGRVHPKQLAEEFLKSGVWFYPTWFAETSCITAMEAQAAGCHVVTSDYAALSETVKDGLLFHMPNEYRSERCCDWFVSSVTACMRIETDSGLAPAAKLAFSLETLADEWDTLLRALLINVGAEPVGKYVPWREAG